jgi:hypothetical protein
MGTTDQLKMLRDLETYLENHESVKIIKNDGSQISGNVINIVKDLAAELFLDPMSGNVIDADKFIIKLTLTEKANDNQIEIGFRDIANFEPCL